MKAETPPSASSRPIGFTYHMMLADIGAICLHLAVNIACFPSEDRRYEFSSFAHFVSEIRIYQPSPVRL